MNKLLLGLCLVFFLQKVQAQNPENELGNWYMYNGSHKISEKFAIKTMAHFRYFELASNFQQEIYRLGANYTFNPNINVTLGYSFVTTDLLFNEPSPLLIEHRAYEDLNIKSKLNKFTLKQRIRLEHRFFYDLPSSHWFRYDINVSYPIAKNWAVYAYNELFLNIDEAKRFVQNWTGAGFTRTISKNIKLNFGYFQIKLPDAVLKRLQIGIVLNTNHQKKN